MAIDNRSAAQTERHPLKPFLPERAGILFLGSFPPPRARWSMDFFYPNFINDFWRIMGLLFFGVREHFELSGGEGGKKRKGFDRERIVAFAQEHGFAFYDTAAAVRRLRGNASDAHLEIVAPTDVAALLARIPLCDRIVTTGGKATEEFLSILASLGAVPARCRGGIRQEAQIPVPGTQNPSAAEAVRPPAIGEGVRLRIPLGDQEAREIEWWRMPSTSRAYPLPFTEKAAFYSRLFPELH